MYAAYAGENSINQIHEFLIFYCRCHHRFRVCRMHEIQCDQFKVFRKERRNRFLHELSFPFNGK